MANKLKAEKFSVVRLRFQLWWVEKYVFINTTQGFFTLVWFFFFSL